MRMARVLVADSHPGGADYLAALVQSWGHEAVIARDGPAALGLARALRPDAIVADAGLAGLAGPELVRRLVREEARPRLVALGAQHGDLPRREALRAGFDFYLVKPVSPDLLRAVLPAPRRGGPGEPGGPQGGRP